MSAETPAAPTTPFTQTSTARVATTRPARYGRQLTSHMGRQVTAAWNAATATGSLDLDRGGTSTGLCHLRCSDGELVLTLHSDESYLARLEEVVGVHLARFGSKDALTVALERADGRPGTTQGPLSAEDLERLRLEREARRSATD